MVLLTFNVTEAHPWLRQPRSEPFGAPPIGGFTPRTGIPRILELLDNLGVQGTFFVPGVVAETYGPIVQETHYRGHEIAHHGYAVQRPTVMERDEEAEDLDQGIRALRGLLGETPCGYRSPGSAHTPHTLALLKERGFLYDSTLTDDDAPYLVEAGPSGRLLEIPVHWEWTDAAYFPPMPSAQVTGPLQSPEQLFNAWATAFEGVYRYGRALCLTLHPYIIARPGRLLILERLLRHMQAFADVAFLRCVDVAGLWSQEKDAP